MTRDGIGWKVSDVTPAYLSQSEQDAEQGTSDDVTSSDDTVTTPEGSADSTGSDAASE